MNHLTLETDGETRLVVRRSFAAPPALVYRAHTEATLMQQWMLGPDGWTMPVCISEPRPGGRLRCEWSDGKGAGFYLTGEYIELEPGARVLHVERMHLPDPTPDNRVDTRFESDGAGGTRMTMWMTLPDAATRTAMLATGMEHGMEAGYQRLERLAAAGAI